MRIMYWSSDLCSSDLTGAAAAAPKLVNASASAPRKARIAGCARKRLTARLSARRRFELLHATFQLLPPPVGPLRGLIGGLRALGRALHARFEFIDARVDPRERSEERRVGQECVSTFIAGGSAERE